MTLEMLYEWLSQRALGSRQAAAAERLEDRAEAGDVAGAGMEAWTLD